MLQESYDAADKIIEAMKEKGIVVSSEEREEMAETLFDDGIFNGIWDCSVDVAGHTVRAIQEDEYDQHTDNEDDVPEWDDMLCTIVTAPAYIWITKN